MDAEVERVSPYLIPDAPNWNHGMGWVKWMVPDIKSPELNHLSPK